MGSLGWFAFGFQFDPCGVAREKGLLEVCLDNCWCLFLENVTSFKYLLRVNIFVDYALFLQITLIRAGVAVQGPLVNLSLTNKRLIGTM